MVPWNDQVSSQSESGKPGNFVIVADSHQQGTDFGSWEKPAKWGIFFPLGFQFPLPKSKGTKISHGECIGSLG